MGKAGPSASHIVIAWIFKEVNSINFPEQALGVVRQGSTARLSRSEESVCVLLVPGGTVRIEHCFSLVFWSWDYKILKKVFTSSPEIFAGTQLCACGR